MKDELTSREQRYEQCRQRILSDPDMIVAGKIPCSLCGTQVERLAPYGYHNCILAEHIWWIHNRQNWDELRAL